MIVLIKKRKKKQHLSVFDRYREEVIFYLHSGVSIHTIYKLIAQKIEKPPRYQAFYAWLMKTHLRE